VAKIQEQLSELDLYAPRPSSEQGRSSSSNMPIATERRSRSVDVIPRRMLSDVGAEGNGDFACCLRQVIGDNPRKLERLREVFDEWAASDGTVTLAGNPTGRISKKSLGLSLRKLRPCISDADVDHIFTNADTNKDGHLDYQEFLHWFVGCRSLHKDIFSGKPSAQLALADA